MIEIIVGGRVTGKHTLLKELIEKRLDRALKTWSASSRNLVSAPSPIRDVFVFLEGMRYSHMKAIWDKIIAEDYADAKNSGVIRFHVMHFDDLPKILSRLSDYPAQIARWGNWSRIPRTMFVFPRLPQDHFRATQSQGKSALRELFHNGRHFKIDTLAIVSTPIHIPPDLRAQIDLIYHFRTSQRDLLISARYFNKALALQPEIPLFHFCILDNRVLHSGTAQTSLPCYSNKVHVKHKWHKMARRLVLKQLLRCRQLNLPNEIICNVIMKFI